MRTGTVEEHVAEVFVYERRQWVSECTYLTISAGAPVGELVSLVC